MLNILVACEESQAVCTAFRAKGHRAFSADIQECSGGHPEWHIKGDVSPLINGNCEFTLQNGKKEKQIGKWDLLIAHPPCTYLSNAGARHLWKNHKLNVERFKLGLEGKDFFMQFINADCEHIAVENPIPSKIYELPQYAQSIQPYEYGHPYSKKTCLWLKGLPKLIPTNIIDVKQSTKVPGNWFNKGGKDRQKNRAKTFEGIAKAIADQWTEYLLKEE